jgi:magnesium-transporting ATPase (P-type)
LVLCT